MSATARSVNLALQEPRSVLIRQPAGATPTTVESPTLATHYHTPDIHRSAAQIIRPYARSVRKTGLERTGFTGTRGPQIAEPRTPLRTDGRSPASRATRHRRPRRRSRLRTSTPRSAGCIRTRRRRRAMIGGVCPGTPPETTTSRGHVRSIAAAHWDGAGVRLREAHFQGRAPAVARRVRGHRRIDARPVHRRRPTSGPVVGASLNTAIFRGWSFLATPPQARLELAASVGRDCCCVSAWRHARTTESTSPCHGKCELPC